MEVNLMVSQVSRNLQLKYFLHLGCNPQFKAKAKLTYNFNQFLLTERSHNNLLIFVTKQLARETYDKTNKTEPLKCKKQTMQISLQSLQEFVNKFL